MIVKHHLSLLILQVSAYGLKTVLTLMSLDRVEQMSALQMVPDLDIFSGALLAGWNL